MRACLCCTLVLASCVAGSVPARASDDAEARVLEYVRTHLQPGQPLMVTDLYNRVFTQPDERQALNKLYNAFFRIPLFVANYQEKFKSPPTLAVIVEQFDLRSPAAAEVLLRVMESDPRVPQFLTRDPKTGEITHVDVERIKADPKFGQALARQIGGWQGNPAPDAILTRLGGGDLHIADFHGKVLLLEVWFTGCPPCMQEAPALASLDRELSAQGLAIVGANADRILGLEYDDSVRQRYIQDHHITYPIANWTSEGDRAYGGISIFPTLFLMDRKGVIRSHWIGYVQLETLRKAILGVLSEN
ncbi:MAG TPA: TlpA disulfide reductase family protein [Terriglobia bacterium]|nr:TlpA disulfide reductase family protein [Terriglobia bacterium]